MSTERRLRRPADLAREARRARSRRPPREDEDGERHPPREWPISFAGTDRDLAALSVLLSLASLTPRRLLELAQAHPSAAECLSAVLAGEAGSERDRSFARSVEGKSILSRADDAGARLVAVHDEAYPARLLDLFDPPAGVFVRGGLLVGEVRCVAIVGARNCSEAGREIALELARAVAEVGVCVVSGGARGIDASAHAGALAAGGSSIAILGSGIDVAYPRQNLGLLARLAETGAVVSEYPPGTPAEPFRFPARNRIVAALAEAVVVVEGASGSGSLLTAEHALDIGREVMAVPGSIHAELAAAPLGLIREGARTIRGPSDLLEDLGFEDQTRSTAAGGDRLPPGVGVSERERAVWTALREVSPPDRIAAAAGLGLPEAMDALVALELRGLVAQAGGRYRRRLRPPAQEGSH